MQKTKVLQFTIAKSMGGRTQYILNTWRHIDRNRFQFDFVTFSQQLQIESSLKNEGCEIYHISSYPEKNRELFIKEFKEVLRNGYDIIDIHTSYWRNLIVEELSKEAHIPKVIIHGHSTGISYLREGDVDPVKRHYEVKDKLHRGIATDYWACSQAVAEWLFLPQIPKDDVMIIPNSIETDRFRYVPEKRKKIRAELSLEDKFVLGFVGRLEPVKNLGFLIDLFCQIINDNENLNLLIVGGGSEEKRIKEMVHSLGVDDKTIFVGSVSNVEDYYQAMDLLLLPSFLEGFPLVLLEAQCSGLKCISIESIPDEAVIEDKVIRIPLEDKKRWKKTIQNLVNEDYCRLDMSQQLKKLGMDTEMKTKQIEKLYLK